MNIKDIYSRANRPVKVCLVFIAGCFVMASIIGFSAVFVFLASIHALLALAALILLIAIIVVYVPPK